MYYFNILWQGIKRFFVMIWDGFFFFFGMPYEEQAKKLKDYDARGEKNPKTNKISYRANKVSKS